MKIAPGKPEGIEGGQPGQGLTLQGTFYRPAGDQLPDGTRLVVLHQRDPAIGLGQGVEGPLEGLSQSSSTSLNSGSPIWFDRLTMSGGC